MDLQAILLSLPAFSIYGVLLGYLVKMFVDKKIIGIIVSTLKTADKVYDEPHFEKLVGKTLDILGNGNKIEKTVKKKLEKEIKK